MNFVKTVKFAFGELTVTDKFFFKRELKTVEI